MAAPSIPNLLTLKSGAGRGRGRSQPLRTLQDAEAETPTPEQTKKENDTIVQATDTDANVSRLNAVEAGYLDDPFARDFAPSGDIPRRFPIINRGTYARTTAIDRIVSEFLHSSPDTQRQIISLGAGTDTRYFRMMHESHCGPGATEPIGVDLSAAPNLIYHEVDFPINTQIKIATIMGSPRLKQLVGDPIVIRSREAELHGPHYHLHACDLRDLDTSRPWSGAPPHLDHIDPSLPTLLISECCLTYLAPNAADSVVRYFATKLLAPTAPLGLVLYEPINPFDGFGKVMVSNLAKRGIVLQTMRTYHSLAAQRARMNTYGFISGQRAVDIDFMFENWVDEQERRRVARVEMLDEVEELNLLAKHYCIAWGWRDGDDAAIWERWAKLEEADHDDA